MTSKIEQILEVIKGSHVMGDDGLREYHAARLLRDANRKGTTPGRLKAAKLAAKNLRVSVSDSGMGTIKIYNQENGKTYLMHS